MFNDVDVSSILGRGIGVRKKILATTSVVVLGKTQICRYKFADGASRTQRWNRQERAAIEPKSSFSASDCSRQHNLSPRAFCNKDGFVSDETCFIHFKLFFDFSTTFDLFVFFKKLNANLFPLQVKKGDTLLVEFSTDRNSSWSNLN